MQQNTPRLNKSDLKRPHVQISLDLTSIDEALHMARIAIEAGVDWLEAGTPLIVSEGLRAIRVLREHFPTVPIVADLKTMDGGYGAVEKVARAGADWSVVMGAAHPATIKACVAAGRDHGIGVMGDVMATADKVANARLMQDLGIDVISLHTGFDERHAEPQASPWNDLAAVVAAVDIPVQAVGGLQLSDFPRLVASGAPLLVVGAPLVIGNEIVHPGESRDEHLARVLSEVVRSVKTI